VTEERGVVDPAEDPRRWWILFFVLVAMLVVVIDTTVLNVSIPTIRRELDTSLTSVQWVVTGYGLVFACLLVIGGRIGDIIGARSAVVAGVAIFGVGSLLASVSTNIGMLIVGEAVIEGMGAAMITPNTLSLIAGTFSGRARGTAYAAWATVLSTGAILGPVVGGYLTTYHSWRWAFRINVVIAPVVIVAIALLARRDPTYGPRPRVDLTGAALIAVGTFLVLFAISQGDTYGFLTPTHQFTVAGVDAWPVDAPLSVVPFSLVLGIAVLAAFVLTERRQEAQEREPLFRFSQFRVPTFTQATIVGCFIAFAQQGTSFTLALFLQESRNLTPVQNGLWVVPSGVASVLGAPVAGWLIGRVNPTKVLRLGMVVHATGLLAMALLVSSGLSYGFIVIGFVLYGFGNGLAFSQLNRVLLHDVDPVVAGAASGMSSAIRQMVSSSGVAVGAAVFAVSTVHLGFRPGIRVTMLLAASALVIGAAITWRMAPIDVEDDTSRPGPLDELEAIVEADVVGSAGGERTLPG
jgi:EmrB/QacA subfamily drug resistance transporter